MPPKPHERLRELADAFAPAKHYSGAVVQVLLRVAADVLEAEADSKISTISPHDLTSSMPIVQSAACCNCGVLPGHRHWKDCFIGEEEKAGVGTIDDEVKP